MSCTDECIKSAQCNHTIMQLDDAVRNMNRARGNLAFVMLSGKPTPLYKSITDAAETMRLAKQEILRMGKQIDDLRRENEYFRTELE